jgi:hypothetical protein
VPDRVPRTLARRPAAWLAWTRVHTRLAAVVGLVVLRAVFAEAQAVAQHMPEMPGGAVLADGARSQERDPQGGAS